MNSFAYTIITNLFKKTFVDAFLNIKLKRAKKNQSQTGVCMSQRALLNLNGKKGPFRAQFRNDKI